MTYNPTTWKDGDIVTSAKLNKIEQGIAAGGGFLIINDIDGTLDKTWQEIYDAGCGVIVKREDGDITNCIIIGIGAADNEYYIDAISNEYNYYKTNDPNEYPVYQPSAA